MQSLFKYPMRVGVDLCNCCNAKTKRPSSVTKHNWEGKGKGEHSRLSGTCLRQLAAAAKIGGIPEKQDPGPYDRIQDQGPKTYVLVRRFAELICDVDK